MQVRNLIDIDLVITNLQSKDKTTIIREMADRLTGRVDDVSAITADVIHRESQASTGIGDGIAVPHAKSKHVIIPSIVIAKSSEGVDFDSIDEEPVHLLFLLAVPENSGEEHLQILGRLSKMLLKPDFKEQLMKAKSPQEMIDVIAQFENIQSLPNVASSSSATLANEATTTEAPKKKIVAVTACPTGIAHTFMAQEALEVAAKAMGVDIKVETNGASGVNNQLTKKDIKEADGIILAINRNIDLARFAGRRVIQVGAQDAIKNARSLISNTLEGQGSIVGGSTARTDDASDMDGEGSKTNLASQLYKHLMSGVSFMLPFVISGGILIALAFVIDKMNGVAAGPGLGSTTYLAKLFMTIGKQAFALFVPILGAYLAYSIANRAALTAGLVAGALASAGGCGFLGAIIGGFLAGYITKGLMRVFAFMPRKLDGIKDILIYPILTVLLTSLLMLLLFNAPIKFANDHLVHWLNSMTGANRIILGTLLAGMMAIDMGGPFNKAAYIFGVTSLAAGPSAPMAAVMAGGMVPPLAIALAATIFKRKFTHEQREAATVNYIMGLSFITEGAIPFVASDPLRMIPICMVGSAVSGCLTAVFNVTLPAPHGGLVVMFLSNHFLYYCIAILAGSLVGALLMGLLRKNMPQEPVLPHTIPHQ